MFSMSFSQAIPGPTVPIVIPSNLYAGFKEEFSKNLENNFMHFDWQHIQTSPSEDELNYLLSLAENFGFYFL